MKMEILPRRLPVSLAIAAALTFGGGVIATALLFVAVGRLEYDKVSLGFQQRANLREAAIRRGLDEAVEVLTVTNQLFATTHPVSRDQFRVFTSPLLERYPFIHAFNYHRLLTHAQRDAVEAELSLVMPGTVITEMRPGGRIPAPPRVGYSIVDYLEPMRGNEAAFGLNVATNANVMGALERAVSTNQPAVTGLLSLVQDRRPQSGFEVIMPVFKPGVPLDTPAQRRTALIGDTAVIVRAA